MTTGSRTSTLCSCIWGELDAGHKQLATAEANAVAAQTYGRPVPVQLVWRTWEQFRFNRRYTNSVETNAARDGVVMPRNPENYRAGDYEDEEREYEYDWSNYNEGIRHAETHLETFIFLAEAGRDDLVIGQHVQRALERGMKALIDVAGGAYPNTHSICDLLGAVRHCALGMRDFSRSIPPDVYMAYEGGAEYWVRRQRELTRYPDYLERSRAEVSQIINRARELRGLETPSSRQQ